MRILVVAGILGLMVAGLATGVASPAADKGSAGAAGEPKSGTLSGSVEVSSDLTSPKIRFRLYGDRTAEAPAPGSEAESEVQNVVVYLDSVPFADRAPSRRPLPLVVAQKNVSFSPHVLPVLKGDTVEFPNQDPVFHNVFSLSSASSFDLGRYPRPRSKSIRFDRPGIVKVFCHIHSDMSSVVFVLQNPYFTVPGPDGRFRITGIPPGTYRLVVWHERARSASRRVQIGAGETTQVRVRIPIADVTNT